MTVALRLVDEASVALERSRLAVQTLHFILNTRRLMLRYRPALTAESDPEPPNG